MELHNPLIPVTKILYGPPGTGKTWQAARDAVQIIAGEVPPAEVEARHQALVQAGRIVWVTFHPSYSYEDFIEGYRPVATEKGIAYIPKSGPFRLICESATGATQPGAFLHVGQTLKSTTGQHYEVVDSQPGVVVLRNIKEGKGEGLLTPVSLWVIQRLIDCGYNSGDLSLPGSKKDQQLEITDKVGVDKQTLFGMTGPLRAVWEEVERGRAKISAKAAEPVVMVIDEINRADLSRVFGELITLLEPEKRLGGAEEKRVVLPYSGDLFGVPMNVHLIGTMNTVDRSLSIMDNALRRRFDFEEVIPEPALCSENYASVNLRRLLSEWNHRITALIDREHCLGHAFFLPSRLESIRKACGFEDSDDGKLRALARVIRKNILPLLLEYFHDEWKKADLVLGRDTRKPKEGLLREVKFADVQEAADDLVDLDDVTAFEVAEFWNPHSANWDGSKFIAVINDAK